MRAPLLLCCLLLTANATAGNVYKWKDANGVTQYSEKPPTGQKYESREIDGRAPARPAQASATAAPSAEEQACTNARDNLDLLNSQRAVMQDSNGDGKPDAPMNDEQRQSQKALAEATIKAYCKPAG